MRFGLPKIAFRKHLTALFVSVLIMHLGDYIIIPILPVLLSIEKGLSPVEIGFLLAAGSLSFQVGSIIGGLFSDRIGQKVTLIIGAIIEIIALIGFGFSNTYGLFILFEIFIGIGGGLYAPTVKAAIAEFSADSTDTRTTAFSLRGMAANLGIAIGGLIPLLVFNLTFSTFFFISAAIYIGLLFLTIFFIPKNIDGKHKKIFHIKRYLSIFKNKSFLSFGIISIFVWAIYAQLSLLLPLRVSLIFENVKLVGSIWTITSLLVVLLQTFISIKIIEKMHLLNSIAIGTLIMGIGIFLIGFSHSYLLILLSATIFIIGEMLITPTFDSITSILADSEIMGAYFSMANLVYGIGFALGSYLGGELIEIYGIIDNKTPWLIILISSFIITILVFLTKRLPSIKKQFQK